MDSSGSCDLPQQQQQPDKKRSEAQRRKSNQRRQRSALVKSRHQSEELPIQEPVLPPERCSETADGSSIIIRGKLSDFVPADKQYKIIYVRRRSRPAVLADSSSSLPVFSFSSELSEEKENARNEAKILEANLSRQPTRPKMYVPPAREPLAETPRSSKHQSRASMQHRRQLDSVTLSLSSRRKLFVPKTKILNVDQAPRSRSQSRRRALRGLQLPRYRSPQRPPRRS